MSVWIVRFKIHCSEDTPGRNAPNLFVPALRNPISSLPRRRLDGVACSDAQCFCLRYLFGSVFVLGKVVIVAVWATPSPETARR